VFSLQVHPQQLLVIQEHLKEIADTVGEEGVYMYISMKVGQFQYSSFHPNTQLATL